MEQNDVFYHSKYRIIRFGSKKDGFIVREKGWYSSLTYSYTQKRIQEIAAATKVMGGEFLKIAKSVKKNREAHIAAITMGDINKALEINKKTSLEEIENKLPPEIRHWSHLFFENQSHALPPHRTSDMTIILEKYEKGREKSIP